MVGGFISGYFEIGFKPGEPGYENCMTAILNSETDSAAEPADNVVSLLDRIDLTDSNDTRSRDLHPSGAHSAQLHVAIVGTYTPTHCGIATFTADVESLLKLQNMRVTVVPVVEIDGPPLAIRCDEQATYSAAADQLNALRCDVVLIQHEFGIFGGVAGGHLLYFTSRLDAPYVLTLHTVLPKFAANQALVLKRLCAGAAAVTVFTATARRLLLEQGLVPAHLMKLTPHGAPVELYEAVDVPAAKARMGLPRYGHVLSTFGLLSEGKGIETALFALADIVTRHPRTTFVIAGRTHPDVLRSRGEQYRLRLEQLVFELGLFNHVVFIDRFVTVSELADLLRVTDVFCAPYWGQNQIVSGALTFALAAQCPVVSTPFHYAQDVLAHGAGTLVGFGDHAAFSAAIEDLMVDGPKRQLALQSTAKISTSMSWESVGQNLRTVLSTATQQRIRLGWRASPIGQGTASSARRAL